MIPKHITLVAILLFPLLTHAQSEEEQLEAERLNVLDIMYDRRGNLRRHISEFKGLALKRASEDGVTDKEVCSDLGVSERQLRRWRDQFRLDGDEAFPGLNQSQSEEVAELKRKLKRAEQERDFLKDAAVFFAKESK